jgi:hypothetical protein
MIIKETTKNLEGYWLSSPLSIRNFILRNYGTSFAFVQQFLSPIESKRTLCNMSLLIQRPRKTFSCQNLKNLRINKQVFTLLLTNKDKVSRDGYFLRSVKFNANLTCALKVFKLFKRLVVLYNAKSTSIVKHHWVHISYFILWVFQKYP